MHRKPRSDSKLAALPQAVRDALAEKLLDGESYADAKEWLHLDHCVETSEAALGGFYRHFCAPLRLRRAAEAADALPELAGGLTADWDAGSIALVKQRYFEMLAAPYADPKELAIFAMQIGDINRGKLEAEKLAFNREKHEGTQRVKEETLALAKDKFQRDTCEKFLVWINDERAKAIAGSGATNAEKIEQLGQAMFGEDWHE